MIEKLRAEVQFQQEINVANKVEMKTFKEEKEAEVKTLKEERKTFQEDISEKERIINKMKADDEEKDIQHSLILQTIQNISNQSTEK